MGGPPALPRWQGTSPGYKGLGAQAFQSHGLEMGRKSTGSNPSVFPDSQVIPEWLVLQYFQIHRSYQNAWSFSISRFTGPQNAWSSDAQNYKFRHPTQAI